MKSEKLIALLLLLLGCLHVHAQSSGVVVADSAATLIMRDVFRAMPDSLMPYLSANNRLDFIDFIDSDMRAEVKNRLDRHSEMTALSADSLSIRLSKALRVDMLLLTPLEPVDSCQQVVCRVQTIGVDSLSQTTVVDYFTPQWRPLSVTPRLSEADQRRVKALEVQTILKWDEILLKKS